MGIINAVNDFLWQGIIVLLVGAALYFTLRSRGVQFVYLGEMFRIMLGRDVRERRHIGSFQAFVVSLSSRVGTGNLAGVASAIFMGGPGAVFWMWVMALLGAATAFVESTLAQLYKRRGSDSFYGGPAYYMTHGLHRRWMGVLFAILLLLHFGMANQIVQSNTIITSLSATFGWDKTLLGIVFAFLTLSVIFGGIDRICKFTSICVPFMAVGYLLLALVILAMNITAIPSMLALIVRSAFGFDQAVGGMVGAAVMQGVKRGLFSNEAGEGSAPNAAAIAETSHPVKQGLIQSLGVFTDTLVVCSCTAVIILLSGIWNNGEDGILLTTHALESEIGPVGGYFIVAAILLFAFTTLVSNYYYGESNLRFLFSERHAGKAIFTFRLLTGTVVLLGAYLTLQEAWSLVDLAMGAMTVVNIIAILLLSPQVWRLLRDYRHQKRRHVEPEFHRAQMPEIAADIQCWE